MAIATAQELVTSALRLLQVIDQEGNPTTNQSNQGFDALNIMLDSLHVRGMKYRYNDESIVVSAASHTWGSGGSINTVRPARITEARYVYGTEEYPIAVVPINEYRWITAKNEGGYPEKIAYDPDFPLGVLYIHPYFSGTIKVTSLKPFTQYIALSDNLNLPPGYVRYLRHALTVELSPEYGRAPPEVSIAIGKDMRDELARINSVTPSIEVVDLFRSGIR